MCSKQTHKADHGHTKGHAPRAIQRHSPTGISRPRTVVLRTSNQENPGFSRFPPTFDLDLSSDLLPSELVLLDPGSTGPQDFRNSGLGRTIPLYHTVHSALLFCVLCSEFCTYVRTVLHGSTLQYCSTCTRVESQKAPTKKFDWPCPLTKQYYSSYPAPVHLIGHTQKSWVTGFELS